ncbi:bifunctional DNA primase/polymerase [Streptomyces sp. H27-C3]|uniref:bifunctional DNA primase/polymerase n=1 Tax=Streptomyces sp. H27-C3 TaxID=3046305 RepID=UPI0024BB37E2|nr:bifunctional DNA primase/polymerase [Streptomyces sp. H27-C3]MDJ0465063.1 bifunctional DNA primase/polymerase [Streptomyces sp. H27-C3]
MTDQQALKTAALAAAGRGWRVFPLRPGSTVPAVRDWQSRATDDAERIERCWDAGPFNVGLVLCASGLLVLDLVPADPGERPPLDLRQRGVSDGADVLALLLERGGERFPFETYTVAVPGGGQQYYFAHPAGSPCTPRLSLAWHVEVRCAGYTPGAGSVVRGGAYGLVHDAAPQAGPEWLTVGPLHPARRGPGPGGKPPGLRQRGVV